MQCTQREARGKSRKADASSVPWPKGTEANPWGSTRLVLPGGCTERMLFCFMPSVVHPHFLPSHLQFPGCRGLHYCFEHVRYLKCSPKEFSRWWAQLSSLFNSIMVHSRLQCCCRQIFLCICTGRACKGQPGKHN